MSKSVVGAAVVLGTALVAAAFVVANSREPAEPRSSTTTTSTVPATTSSPDPTTTRSIWCNNRDAGLWPRHDPAPYDPGPVDAEKAVIEQRLAASLERQLRQADATWDLMIENDPTRRDDIEDARRNNRNQIRHAYTTAIADLERNFAREHRKARQTHEALEHERAELAALELDNELKRYELECR